MRQNAHSEDAIAVVQAGKAIAQERVCIAAEWHWSSGCRGPTRIFPAVSPENTSPGVGIDWLRRPCALAESNFSPSPAPGMANGARLHDQPKLFRPWPPSTLQQAPHCGGRFGTAPVQPWGPKTRAFLGGGSQPGGFRGAMVCSFWTTAR